MRLEQIDKNFVVETELNEPDLVWFNVRETVFSIHGVFYDENLKKYLRLPQSVADAVSEGVSVLNANTSGGRVRFQTDSSYIAVYAVMPYSLSRVHMTRTGQSGFDLYRRVDGKETYFRTFIPPREWKNGYISGTKTFGEQSDYTINFPLYDEVHELYVGLKKGATLRVATPYKYTQPIVFYGSSITQGGCASRPGNSYQGILSRKLNTDFINLGFSGTGKGESEMAEYISRLSMRAFVMDYDSNAPNEEWLKVTHYPFYKIIREKNPTLPIIIISHVDASHGIFYRLVSSTWGTFENRRDIIKDTYLRARAEGDENVYFIDGKDVFAGEDYDEVTVDGIHPNDFGFYRFAQFLKDVLGPLLGEESSQK